MNKDLIIQLQSKQIQELKRQIVILMARVEELENNQKKNSSNSSKAPSSDIGKVQRTKSLRVGSGKEVGGQPGQKGHTLEISATPDSVEVHSVGKCTGCGKDISRLQTYDYEIRQECDIPPIRL